MNFDSLLSTINSAHLSLQESAIKAVNKHLTIRNWLIGFYIVEFEQNGEDRAQYGERLVDEIAVNLKTKGFGARNLKLFRAVLFSLLSNRNRDSCSIKRIRV